MWLRPKVLSASFLIAASAINTTAARTEEIIHTTADWNAAREENLYYLFTRNEGGILKFGVDINQKKVYVELDGPAADKIPDRSSVTFLFDARDSINEVAKQVQGERFDFLPTIPPGFSFRVNMTSSAGRVDELPDRCFSTAAPLPDLVVVVKFNVVDPGTGQSKYIVIGQSHVGRRVYVKSLRRFLFR